MPQHRLLGKDDLHPEIAERLSNSLVLMHGGMAQNVGPILEMVTEKYLLRVEKEWEARLATNEIYEGILSALKTGDISELAKWTSYNWEYPIKTIIPWATTHYTETLIQKAKQRFGDDYLGFMMLGGMSGGGMGMYVNSEQYEARKQGVLDILKESKAELSSALPFAMEPVVYNFKINNKGTFANLKEGTLAFMPARYYSLQIAQLAKLPTETIPYQRKLEMELYSSQIEAGASSYNLLRSLVSNLFQVSDAAQGDQKAQQNELAAKIKSANGFDSIQHERIREDLQKGRIGLGRNRLSAETSIEDVQDGDVLDLSKVDAIALGEAALKAGKVAVLSLAGGIGSRWTKAQGSSKPSILLQCSKENIVLFWSFTSQKHKK